SSTKDDCKRRARSPNGYRQIGRLDGGLESCPARTPPVSPVGLRSGCDGSALLPSAGDVVADRLVRPAQVRTVVDREPGGTSFIDAHPSLAPGPIPPRNRLDGGAPKDQRLLSHGASLSHMVSWVGNAGDGEMIP